MMFLERLGADSTAILDEVKSMSKKNHSVPVPSESDSKLKEAILLLQDPFGDEPHQREQFRAVQYLLDNAARTHPYLLELLRSQKAANPYAVIEILPKFGLQESIPILEELMTRGPANLSQAAAQALAVHPLQEAQEALLRGLNLPNEEFVIPAIDGLMIRGDASVCPELKKFLTYEDSSVRYHAIQAAGTLGCLERETLFAIARNDLSEDIRKLANQIVKTASEQGAKP